jgi:hypothetical protein
MRISGMAESPAGKLSHARCDRFPLLLNPGQFCWQGLDARLYILARICSGKGDEARFASQRSFIKDERVGTTLSFYAQSEPIAG